ncbi:hypothetical protein [Prevotella sp. 10(H)]|uniref:hypothetical protein n=1 Tax=Prevotella sp. 10(H) TaxID=1158294 RepID=UPI0004A6F4B6|nr:hypothetical protein [Prevotella sp. 10(H)]
MKQLILCCLCILALMACGERSNIMGRWAIVIEESDDTFIRMPDDTIVSPEILFEYDTVYMEVKSSQGTVKSECLGIYKVNGDYIKVTDRYGKQRECKFIIKEDMLTVMDKDDTDKVLMRLRRIKED